MTRPSIDADTAARLRAELVQFYAHRTRDRARADDLAQEALAHVLAGIGRFRGDAAFRTWTQRIALNVWRDHLRHVKTDAAAPAREGTPFSLDAVLDEIGAPAPPPDEVFDRRATHDCLLDAVRRLPPAARRVLLLHDFGDMPLDRAAPALGCSAGTAKVRLHRARRRLAEACRAECVGDTAADGAPLCTRKPHRRP
jgi:RNA polymerase sigma-70 factor (ECF subfamily)